jgi:hypothetical protein
MTFFNPSYEPNCSLSGAENPTYLKHSTDKIVTGIAITFAITGVVLILDGVKNMSFGINKK